MKAPAVLAILIAFCVTAAAQTATGIHLVDVRFRGQTQIKDVDLSKCAAELKSKDYAGPDWLDGIAEFVRRRCLQDNGYFKAIVFDPNAEQLPDKHATHQFIVTFNLDPGQQFRTGNITFTNNRVFSTAKLRSMFTLTSGDVFHPVRIRQGLEQMHSAYIALGYRDFTAVPDTTIDESDHLISVNIDCDEGRQFH